MGRKLAGVVFAVSTLHASVVSALGMGELELKSGLNQPLEAEIALKNIGDLNEQQIVVELASSDAFQRAGVDRVFFLGDLKFAVNLDGKGNGVVKVTSKRLVREPYLDFILEARWPNGRLMREYTVLVDLPNFSDKAVATPAPAASTQASQPRVSNGATKARVPAPAASSAAIPQSAPAKGEVVSQKSDTLWKLASRARPAGSSMQQTMMAIYRNNQQAFAKQNINGLRSGQVLRMPSAEQINELSKQQAIAAVAQQNEAWKTGTTAPLDASGTSVAQSADAKPAQESYMKLSNAASSSASGAGSSAGIDEGSNVEAVRSELNAAQEKLDRATMENSELDGRLEDLEGQIQTLEKLVELKDTQLANMQGRLEQAPADSEAAPVDQNFAAQEAETAAESAEQAEPGLMDKLMSPLYLGGIGALVMLAVAGVVMRRRSSEEGDDDNDWQQQAVAVEEPASDDTAAVFAALSEESDEQTEQEVAENTVAAEIDSGLGTPANDELKSFDPLAEAEMFCSYDRHDEALEMLRNAIGQEPERGELHLKLLAILSDLDRRDEFVAAYGQLVALGSDDSAQLAEQMVVEKGWLEPGDNSAADTLVDASLELQEEREDSSSEASDEGDLTQELDNADLDFDLDFDLTEVDSLESTDQNPGLDLAVDNVELEAEDEGLDFDISLADEVADLEGENNSLDLSEFKPEEAGEEEQQGAEAKALADILDSGADLDDDLSEMVDGDEIATKLDLARAYVDMGDVDGARDILDEVLQEGSEGQVEEANSLLRNLAS